MRIKNILLLSTLSVTLSFSYFNDREDTLSRKSYLKVNSYDYYNEGIKDTISQINHELINGKNTGEIANLNRFLVVKEVVIQNTSEIIFLRETAFKLGYKETNIIKNTQDGKFYVLFYHTNDKDKANFVKDRVFAYNVNAKVLNKGSSKFVYYNLIKDSLNLDAKEVLGDTPVKVITIEKTKYLGEDLNLPKVKEKRESKATTQPKKIAKETKAYSNKSQNQVKAKSKTKKESIKVSDTIDATIITKETENLEDNATKQSNCLKEFLDEVKYYGYFNLATSQFKLNDVVYNNKDEIKYKDCILKVVDIKTKDKEFFMELDSNSSQTLEVKVKLPTKNFITTEELLFNPYESVKKEVKYIPKRVKNNLTLNQQITQSQKDTNVTTSTISNTDNINASATRTAETEYVVVTADKSTPLQRSENSVYAKCNFKISTGIRTQLIRQADGSFRNEPVYDYYKGKESVEVDYYTDNTSGNIVVSAIGGQPMMISRDKFEESCIK